MSQQKGRPSLRRLPPGLAAEFRADFSQKMRARTRFNGEGREVRHAAVTSKQIAAAFRPRGSFLELPARNIRWVQRARQRDNDLAALDAIELAERADRLGRRLSESVLTKVEMFLSSREPNAAIIVFPDQGQTLAADITALIGSTTLCSPRELKRIREKLEHKFASYEHANAFEPVRGAITSIQKELGSDLPQRFRMLRQATLLTEINGIAVPANGNAYSAPSTLAILSQRRQNPSAGNLLDEHL